jgi:hypothetical protein
MELFLNAVWVVMAIEAVSFWLRFEGRERTKKLSPFVALIMLLVIFFPVISVSDDLWSLHNPAEADTCQCRDQAGACPHSIFPVVAALPEATPAERTFGFRRFVLPFCLRQPTLEKPALTQVQNRPPPTA